MLSVKVKELANDRRLGFVDHQLPFAAEITERWNTAHPDPLLLGGGDLVPNPLGGDLPFKLRERQQDIQHQPAHGGCRVERLGYGDEGAFRLIQPFDQLGEVHQGAGQAVNLVDNHHVDPAGIDVGHQASQCRALKRPPGKSAIVVAAGRQLPSFTPLAGDVCEAGLELGVQRIELLFEALVGGLARVDRAANDPAFVGHQPDLAFRPKNRGPDHLAPVISKAIRVSDG